MNKQKENTPSLQATLSDPTHCQAQHLPKPSQHRDWHWQFGARSCASPAGS